MEQRIDAGGPPELTVDPATLKIDHRLAAGQLALEMIHEIRNPLEALGHLTYLTMEEPYEAEKVIRYMQMAEEQLATLNHIVSQTLGFARSSADHKPCDMADLTEAALRIHQRMIRERNIHIVRDLSSGHIASIHKGEILQVVSNLIANALDALPGAGTVTLRLRKQGGKVHLVVADNGHGIAAENASRIFEPFFTTKNEHGTGLGLALSKKIVDQHGGRLRMRSSIRPQLSGTTFVISLPA